MNLKWTLLFPKSKTLENIHKLLERSSHTVNLIQSKLYAYGGENEPRIPIDDNIMTYDIASQKWTIAEISNVQNKPFARIGHTSCVIDKNIFIFGGRTGIDMGEGSLNDLHAFDANLKTWIQLKQNMTDEENTPPPRSYHTMTSLKNKLYIFGGCSADHGRLNDLFEFDLVQSKWKKLKSDDRIAPRGGAGLCAFESPNESVESSCLYVIGGFKGEEIDDVFKYDLNKNEWTQIQSLPRKLSVFACSAVNSDKWLIDGKRVRILVHGGEIDPSTKGHNGAGEFSSDLYAFDGEKWHILKISGDKPTNRGWHSSCFDEENDTFYVFGGNLEDNKRTNELWSLTL